MSATTNQEQQQKIELFNRWAPFYDRLFPTVFYQAIHQRLLAYVDLPETPQVLDLGCGTGRLLRRLSERYPQLYGIGIDPSPEMLRQARRSKPRFSKDTTPSPRLIFIQGSAEAIRATTAQFDAVFNTISFLHYPHPEPVLSEVHRVLKPGGCYYLVDFVWQRQTEQVQLQAAAGKMRFYGLSKREEMGLGAGLQTIGHYTLLGPVVLTVFVK
ncbi:class I SAM-dependent methyltransferase [Geitlerinema sp. PCC 9228]|uniref:class I SAM-dependent methyltransferase n=1 Tax=Geitlerinema sp. PCC 9228 TaxID=111611 RepID=UPI0008F9BD19|nr:class I SAM-dependent methyltransferase [Geitlerinema sp. PCC 9228]